MALRAIFVAVATVGIVLAAATVPLAGVGAATSVAIGALIAIGNLWALKSIVAVLVDAAAGSRATSGLGFFLVPKVIALFGVVWLLLARHLVSAGPLALGYAALPIGVAIGALVCKKGG